MNSLKALLALSFALLAGSIALAAEPARPESLPQGQSMYVIERDMPGLGQLTAADLKGASQKSCSVLKNLGPDIVWLQSYVTGDKLYCVYLAPNEQIIREH